ncbi:SDR family oxidoreductase, partial [candidate division WWE3 bacterium]|nr:SDR family oxidoreductase [candidate division WWE3 bacterium]
VSRGIGTSIAKKLHSEGVTIHGTYNSSKKEALALQDRLENLVLHHVDFYDRKQTLQFVDELSSIQFDYIINNAGIILFEQFDEVTYATWDAVLEVNLTTPFILTHALRNNINDGGVVVNIASTDGLTGAYVSMSYSVSKAALMNLTKSLGNVFGARGIRVVGIAPGWVGSGMDSPAIQEAIENNPLGRNAETSDIANVVSFLISDKAAFINGETIVVDGGYSNVDPILKKEAEAME